MKNKKIFIIGESHTRHFAFRNNIAPIFMGSGKTINLDNIEILQENIDKVIDNIVNLNDSLVFLYIGEPNCRIKLANHWTPHWDELHHGKEINTKPDFEYLESCIRKYSTIDMKNIDYLITPTCAYDPVLPSLEVFNNFLKKQFGEKVVDIFQYTKNEQGKVLDDLKAKDWEKDPIHLNSKICDIFLEELNQTNIIDSSAYYSQQLDGHFGTHIFRCTDQSKFGSYIIK